MGRALDCYDKMTAEQLAIPEHLRGEWIEPVIMATMHSAKPEDIDKHQLYLPQHTDQDDKPLTHFLMKAEDRGSTPRLEVYRTRRHAETAQGTYAATARHIILTAREMAEALRD